MSSNNKPRQLSAFRSFDFAAIVVRMSEGDFSVIRAVKVPRAVIEETVQMIDALVGTGVTSIRVAKQTRLAASL